MIDDCTTDDLLGGALRLRQPRSGYRIGMDTVLLAAAIPANPGDRLLEPGIGTGGAALCLVNRVEKTSIHGVDMKSDHLALANHNFAANGFADRLTTQKGDITQITGNGSEFDHCLMNPPFGLDGAGRPPKGEGKAMAHVALGSSLADWVRYGVHHTKAKGSITLIHRADQLDQIISLMAGPCGTLKIYPLWPRAGEPATRVIVQGQKATKGRTRLLPGLILHGGSERYTPEASAILRDGAPLVM